MLLLGLFFLFFNVRRKLVVDIEIRSTKAHVITQYSTPSLFISLIEKLNTFSLIIPQIAINGSVHLDTLWSVNNERCSGWLWRYGREIWARIVGLATIGLMEDSDD